MKKQFLFFALGCASLHLQAQYIDNSIVTSNGSTSYTNGAGASGNGKVGIGFSSITIPVGMLHVKLHLVQLLPSLKVAMWGSQT